MKREPVPPPSDRDQWLRRLMPQVTSAADACLDAETIAAWADGALSGKALAAAEQHVSECSRCLSLTAAIQRTAPNPVKTHDSRRVLWGWIVPLTAAATAVALWIAIPPLQQPVQQKSEAATALQERESVAPPPAPPAASPVPEPPREEMQAQGAAASESLTARRDAAADRFRSQDNDLKREGKVAEADDALQKRAAVAPESPPAAAAEAPADSPPARSAGGVAARNEEARALRDSRSTLNAEKPGVLELAASDPRIRWRVTGGVTVERTSDGGKTWIKTSSPPVPVVSIRDVDVLRATVTVSDGRAFTTSDGGATWTVQEKPAAPF